MCQQGELTIDFMLHIHVDSLAPGGRKESALSNRRVVVGENDGKLHPQSTVRANNAMSHCLLNKNPRPWYTNNVMAWNSHSIDL